jgi:hypothetical protein
MLNENDRKGDKQEYVPPNNSCLSPFLEFYQEFNIVTLPRHGFLIPREDGVSTRMQKSLLMGNPCSFGGDVFPNTQQMMDAETLRKSEHAERYNYLVTTTEST